MMGTALAPRDAERLADLEVTIAQGLTTFVEVGAALAEIREVRLYRESHGTFEDYCRERWGMSKRHANRLVESATVVGNLGPIGPTLPATESQARPLAALKDPDEQREAWREAVETAPTDSDGKPKVTAAHVAAVVETRREPEPNGNRLAVHHSSDTGEWYTPKHIIAAVVETLGAIDLDPCSNPGEPAIPAARHFTYVDDGLKQEWSGRVYMNPPYGRGIGDWTEKLRLAHEAGEVPEAVALVPARTDTGWMHALSDYPRCFIRGRLSFSGHDNAAPFPSCAVYFGVDPYGFARAFGDLGDTYVLID